MERLGVEPWPAFATRISIGPISASKRRNIVETCAGSPTSASMTSARRPPASRTRRDVSSAPSVARPVVDPDVGSSRREGHRDALADAAAGAGHQRILTSSLISTGGPFSLPGHHQSAAAGRGEASRTRSAACAVRRPGFCIRKENPRATKQTRAPT